MPFFQWIDTLACYMVINRDNSTQRNSDMQICGKND